MTAVTALSTKQDQATMQRLARALNRPGFAMTAIKELAGAITELDSENPHDVERIYHLAECIAYQAEMGQADIAKVVQLLK